MSLLILASDILLLVSGMAALHTGKGVADALGNGHPDPPRDRKALVAAC
jgi:hypothetical protein